METAHSLSYMLHTAYKPTWEKIGYTDVLEPALLSHRTKKKSDFILRTLEN